MAEVSSAKLLHASEVVDLIGLSRSKVYGMAASGELPTVRIGRSVRFPLTALTRWIEANMVLVSSSPRVPDAKG